MRQQALTCTVPRAASRVAIDHTESEIATCMSQKMQRSRLYFIMYALVQLEYCSDVGVALDMAAVSLSFL